MSFYSVIDTREYKKARVFDTSSKIFPASLDNAYFRQVHCPILFADIRLSMPCTNTPAYLPFATEMQEKILHC